MKKAVLLAVGNDYPRWDRAMTVTPPLGILAMGSSLAAHDVPVELIDVQMDVGFGLTADIERVVARRVARHLGDQTDTIGWVGISQHSNTSSGLVLAQEIRSVLPETPIVLGGYFPSGNYRQLLPNNPFITAIVRGDGEAAALEISDKLAQGESFLSEDTPNLAWLSNGEIHQNPVQTATLKELPIFDFTLLRNPHCYQLLSLPTSRGCPFKCNYCLEMGMRSYSAYPLDWLDRQLVHMQAELSSRCIFIADPIFGLSRERTPDVCRIMQKYDFSWGLQSRVDVLTPDVLPLLSKSGAELIYWGMESASPDSLLRMNKVRSLAEAETYLDDARKVLKACFENDIAPVLGLMLAFPGDTEADCRASLEFAQEIRQIRDQVAAETGVMAPFIPYAWQTQIYEGSPLAACMAHDYPDVMVRQEPFEGESMVLSPSPEVPSETVQKYRKEIEYCGDYSPRVVELMERYFRASSKDFAETHPDLIDSQGVTALCDEVQPFPVS